jgi:hypothetical protein
VGEPTNDDPTDSECECDSEPNAFSEDESTPGQVGCKCEWSSAKARKLAKRVFVICLAISTYVIWWPFSRLYRHLLSCLPRTKCWRKKVTRSVLLKRHAT